MGFVWAIGIIGFQLGYINVAFLCFFRVLGLMWVFQLLHYLTWFLI